MTQPDNPNSGLVAVSNANHAVDDRDVVRRSTRVLLDSSTPPTCDACDSPIDHGERYKCVTVRERSGRVTDLSFCDDRCRSTYL